MSGTDGRQGQTDDGSSHAYAHIAMQLGETGPVSLGISRRVDRDYIAHTLLTSHYLTLITTLNSSTGIAATHSLRLGSLTGERRASPGAGCTSNLSMMWESAV